MDNLNVLNNTFFLRERTCAKKEKGVPYAVQRKHFDQTFSKSLMVQVHEGAKAKRRGGALYKYPNK